MLYRMILLFALVPFNAFASQKSENIRRLLHVTPIIIPSILADTDWLRALGTFKYLNEVNKEWHEVLNMPRIFKHIIVAVAEQADGRDEIGIANGMQRWPAFTSVEFQAWFKKRSEERKLENELFSAATDNKPDAIRALITQKKVNVDARDNSGKTPLSIAASSAERTDALKEILKHNPKVNWPNKGGWTPLQQAANVGNIQAVRLLLMAGADPNRPNKQGYTPLLNAAFYNYLKIMQLLINAKADVNHFPHDKCYNPLMAAVMNNHVHAITLLLNSGAQKDLANNQGETALHIARKKHASTLIHLLEPGSLESILTARMIPGNGGGLTDFLMSGN